jgi:hypothetical protein
MDDKQVQKMAAAKSEVARRTRWKLELTCAAIRCVEPEGGAQDAKGRTGRYRLDVKVRGERGWKPMAVGEDPHALLQEAVNTSLVHLDLNWAKTDA